MTGDFSLLGSETKLFLFLFFTCDIYQITIPDTSLLRQMEVLDITAIFVRVSLAKFS